MKLKPIRTALLAVASSALASCALFSDKSPPPSPEVCSPAMVGTIIGEPIVPDNAGIVAPCDPARPPAGATPAQCEAERSATAAYLASDAERTAWGREGWGRLAVIKARCAEREKGV